MTTQQHNTDRNFDVMTAGGAPIKMWTRGVPVEDKARAQLANISQLPFIHRHMAVMPDVHLGKGATVGSVIPTIGAIVPAAVGVDIGCGMMAPAHHADGERLAGQPRRRPSCHRAGGTARPHPQRSLRRSGCLAQRAQGQCPSMVRIGR